MCWPEATEARFTTQPLNAHVQYKAEGNINIVDANKELVHEGQVVVDEANEVEGVMQTPSRLTYSIQITTTFLK